MEIMALDGAFAPLKYLKPINVQWTRKYYEVGDFSIQIVASEYSGDMAYVYTPDRPELGIIQKVEYTTSYHGAFVQLSGFFAERMLDYKAFYPACNERGNIETVCRAAVNAYKDDLPLLTLGAVAGLGESIEISKLGEQIGTTLYELLKTQELSQRLRYDYQSSALLYEVWQGLDRTQEQTENTWAIFAQSLDTLGQPEYTVDTSNEYNFFVIQANGTITKTLDLSGGGVKRVKYIDQRGSTPADGQSAAQFADELQQKLREAAAESAAATELTFTVPENMLAKYRNGFDLGDKCDIVIDDISLSMSARIIEISEVWKAGHHTIEPVFGTGLPTIYKRVRL